MTHPHVWVSLRALEGDGNQLPPRGRRRSAPIRLFTYSHTVIWCDSVFRCAKLNTALRLAKEPP